MKYENLNLAKKLCGEKKIVSDAISALQYNSERGTYPTIAILPVDTDKAIIDVPDIEEGNMQTIISSFICGLKEIENNLLKKIKEL